MDEPLIAPERSKFCELLAAARRLKLNGYWDGSSYRHHPCGIVRKGIVFTNEWSTHDYCSARVILDPTSPPAARCHRSSADGDASWRPERGGMLTVYNSGTWSEDDGPWRKIIIDILAELEKEIVVAEALEEERRKEQDRIKEDEHQAEVEKAKRAISNQV